MKKIRINFLYVFVSLILVFPIFFTFAEVKGQSMESTLFEKDYLLVSNYAKVHNGDIVIVRIDGSKDYLVKRVVGVAGDKLRFDRHNLYRNNKKLKEDYVNKSEKPEYYDYTETVADNSYYVLGDNRNHSGDSRYFGDVSASEIVGVVWFNFRTIGLNKQCFLTLIVLVYITILPFLMSDTKVGGIKESRYEK